MLVFDDPDAKSDHMRSKHGNISNPSSSSVPSSSIDPNLDEFNSFGCPDCPKRYAVADSLRKHCRTTHGRHVATCR